MSVVETSYGRVRGANQYGVHVFKGIPFAKPPVGDLRWRAPVPPAPWAGTREALGFGPCAVQSTIPGDVGELIGIATHEVSEDCLYLNVWTPKPDDARRPVMVWIHGGGNTLGAGSQPRVNGEHLARVGDVVVVTLNYRLGALGFLYAPELGATGNEALLDQVAALRWVRAEIGAFGGDPDNVTVFGQSAGGFDIAQLMAMPAAQGCFDRAVPMSGSLKRQATADSAYATAQSLAGHFGGFERLRAVPTTDTLGYQMRMTSTGWGPTCDGEVIAEDAAKVLARGTGDGMPLMIGHTRDESTLFTAFNKELANMDGAQLTQLARGPFGTRAADAARATSRIEPMRVCAPGRSISGRRSPPTGCSGFRRFAPPSAVCAPTPQNAGGQKTRRAPAHRPRTRLCGCIGSITNRQRVKDACKPAIRSTFHLCGARMRCLECDVSAVPVKRWNACRVASWRAISPSRATVIPRTRKCRFGRNTTWTRAERCCSPKRPKWSRHSWTLCANSGRPWRPSRTST